MGLRATWRAFLTVIAAAAIVALAAPAAAPAATIGPLVLEGPTTTTSENSSVQNFEFRKRINPGGKLPPVNLNPNAPPQDVFYLSVTKLVDASSPALTKAVVDGTHFKRVSLTWTIDGALHSLCLGDALIASRIDAVGSQVPAETLSIYGAEVVPDVAGPGACAALPRPEATVTYLAKGPAITAKVTCFSPTCRYSVALKLPQRACVATGGGCAGGSVRLGRVALTDGRSRVLRVRLTRGQRRAFARIGDTRSIIAVLRRRGTTGQPPGPPIRVRAVNAGRPVTLPGGLPAVQSGPGAPTPSAPAPTTGGGPTAPAATALAITTCGPVGVFPRQFAGTIAPPVAGLSITMTYTPPTGAPIQQTVTTTATGTFTDTVAAATPGAWSAQASFGGTPSHAASVSPACGFQGG